ncbi:putative DUF652 domain protein [Rosellinia necatrix]|uniref:Putative DUF652 domain protein n=1 Tax=Rosellinia necatrix TaxID=77044 RepID=A0A1S8A6P7_ROSNE|nr:putative DUF652 domain protein [Rosellinia necatrix]
MGARRSPKRIQAKEYLLTFIVIYSHKGTYADDCIVDRVMKHRIYIVATNDKDLVRRIRKIPGVPIMNAARGKYVIERLPGAPDP